MKEISKLKELAVPVSERLPESEGNYIVILNEKIIDIERLIVNSNGNKYWYDYLGITHWIDLDLLTTKKKAIELANEAWEDGFLTGYDGLNYPPYFDKDKEDFITENQNKL